MLLVKQSSQLEASGDKRSFRYLPFHSRDYRSYVSRTRWKKRRWTIILIFIVMVQLGLIYYLMAKTTLLNEVEKSLNDPNHELSINGVMETVFKSDN